MLVDATGVNRKAVALQDMEEMSRNEIDNCGYYWGTLLLLDKLKQHFSHLQSEKIRESRNVVATHFLPDYYKQL